jgi:molybdopterin synthase sulfur carrier subunit
MIRVLYFAGLRERVGTGAEEIPIGGCRTVADLRERLRARGGEWAAALAVDRTVLCAVNQGMAQPETRVADGDEVAFFPPVTGG